MKELDRIAWSALRSGSDPNEIPVAIETLAQTSDAAEAEKAYWRIDNNAVIQGGLYEVAPETIAGLLSALCRSTDVGRKYILELLVELASGEPRASEAELGNTGLPDVCAGEIARGAALYFDRLERGTMEEALICVDLAGICALHDEALKPRALWWFENLLSLDFCDNDKTLIRNWIGELT